MLYSIFSLSFPDTMCARWLAGVVSASELASAEQAVRPQRGRPNRKGAEMSKAFHKRSTFRHTYGDAKKSERGSRLKLIDLVHLHDSHYLVRIC
jgi:hypothetical protein